MTIQPTFVTITNVGFFMVFLQFLGLISEYTKDSMLQ